MKLLSRIVTGYSVRIIFGAAAGLIWTTLAQADEPTRQAQEELRRRNLYLGDINGRMTQEFRGALRRYQEHKGFTETGRLDRVTANSLKISASDEPTALEPEAWPDEPVLKSDTARQLSEEKKAVPREAGGLAEPTPSVAAPEPPAEAPSPAATFTAEEITALVHAYLRDAATNNVEVQTRYYQFPVEYFDHGPVDEQGVQRDTAAYVQRWPDRSYTLVGPISSTGSNIDGETLVQFSLDFTVANGKRRASGRTRNFWTITRDPGGSSKIAAIREARIPR